MPRRSVVGGLRVCGSKVRSGCETCKTRRIKCDESRPHCQRCITAGHKCPGYSAHWEASTNFVGHKFVHYVAPQPTDQTDDGPIGIRSSVVSQSLSPHPDLDGLALRSLDFYVGCIALQLGGHQGTRIFSREMLQLMHDSTAIRHCLVALAIFQEDYIFNRRPDLHANRMRVALGHYNQSIRGVVHLHRENPTQAALVTLVTCLLYCAIELVQGHLASGMRHVEAGVRLLSEQGHRLYKSEQVGFGGDVGLTRTLQRLFIGLESQTEGIQETELDTQEKARLSVLATATTPVKAIDYVTAEEALEDYLLLQNDAWLFIARADMQYNDPDFPSDELMRIRNSLDVRMSQWTTACQKLLTYLPSQNSAETKLHLPSLLVLRINHLMLSIDLGIQFGETEMKYDHFLDKFQSIVELSQQFLDLEKPQLYTGEGHFVQTPDPVAPRSSFTLSVGVLPALFFTAARCRDPVTRRRAAWTLQTANRRESVWDSHVVGIVAQRLIELEEAATVRCWTQSGAYARSTEPAISSAGDVPEQCRVQEVQASCGPSEESTRAFLRQLVDSRQEETFLIWDAETPGKYFVLST